MKKNIEDEEVLEVINEKYMELFPAEKKVVDAILKKPQNVVNYNAADLAKKSDVSVATIVRLCHHLGYEGYYQFRLLLSRDLGKKQHRVKKSGDAFGSYVEELADSVLAIGKRLEPGSAERSAGSTEECADGTSDCLWQCYQCIPLYGIPSGTSGYSLHLFGTSGIHHQSYQSGQ